MLRDNPYADIPATPSTPKVMEAWKSDCFACNI